MKRLACVALLALCACAQPPVPKTRPAGAVLQTQAGRATPVPAPAKPARPPRPAASPLVPLPLPAVFSKPLNLEFHDAPLRDVFEALGRSANVNFVFDREVRGDATLSLQLSGVTLEEALRLIQSTQQLEHKLLNPRTLLIYPNTQAKQREHQELMIRSFYLTNADVKQVQTLVRAMVKTRDVFIDERLNLLMVRDTPEVLALIEKMIATMDLPEPEVVMEVEVLELGRGRTEQLGLSWPEEVRHGLPADVARINVSQGRKLRTSVLNPALAATLKGDSGETTVLANPSLRARNREKAKIQIGEKLPVFSSTISANVGVSATVTYLDVGLKLELEPTVQLDDDVTIKVNIEVTNLLETVTPGPGLSAYRVGTRNANTTLRLRDGETQVLGGLISDDDRKDIRGVPYLSEAPLLGRLFGVHNDDRQQTEVLLLVTPHIVRGLALPDVSAQRIASGYDAQPGGASARLGAQAAASMPMSGGGGGGAPVQRPNASPGLPGQDDGTALVELATSGEATVGETTSVTLLNHSTSTVRGELAFDAVMFQSAEGPAGGGNQGRIPFELPPQGQRVMVLRTLPAAAGGTASFSLAGLTAINPKGETVSVRIQGDGAVEVSSP